jgi:hypothetical protein
MVLNNFKKINISIALMFLVGCGGLPINSVGAVPSMYVSPLEVPPASCERYRESYSDLSQKLVHKSSIKNEDYAYNISILKGSLKAIKAKAQDQGCDWSDA